MYQSIGDEVLDSLELAARIEEKTNFRLKNDLTPAIGREDAIGLRFCCKITDIPGFSKCEEPDEEQINKAMEVLDDFSHIELKKVLFNCYAYMTFAYGYDEVENALLFVLAVMDRDGKKAKLKDVLNKLLKR